MREFVNYLATGVSTGAIYAVFAACLALWFRVSNVLNLAIGDFAMIGAIGCADLVQTHHWALAPSIVVILAVCVAIAWLFDRVVLHFAFAKGERRHDIVAVFFYTFALSLILEGVARSVWGTDVFAAPPVWAGSTIHLGILDLQRPEILTVVVAVIAGTGLWAYLKFTVSGRAASACGESTVGSRIVGINHESFRRRILMLTALLAALFGVIESPTTGFTYSSGASISLLGVVAAGFSSFQRPGRAVVVGLAIGVVETMFSAYVSTIYGDVFLYVLLLVIIVSRPQLLGRETRAV